MQLTSILKAAANAQPNHSATRFQGRRRSWEEMQERVSRLASGFLNNGIKSGDRVALLALNNDTYYEVMFATWWIGGVIVPMNTRWTPSECAYALKDAGARALFVDDVFSEHLNQLAASTALPAHVTSMGSSVNGTVSNDYESLIASSTPAPDQRIGAETLAGIYYTGGTTGFPKGVMLSHQAIWYNALALAPHLPMSNQDVYLHTAPMFHLADNVAGSIALLSGAMHTFLPSFSPSAFLGLAEQMSVTHTLLVPTMLGAILSSPEFEPQRLKTLKMICYGASPMPKGLLETAMRELPWVEFLQGYGQTELAPLVSVLGPGDHKDQSRHPDRLQSAGRALAGCELRVEDENGTLLTDGSVGELVVRSPGSMLGYWNKPKQTNATLKHGWVRTGDGARIDEDGFVYIVDRMKDMIVTGGENVFSAEVETVLSTHDHVDQVAVIGIPDDKWGEAVHAIIIPKTGSRPNPDDIVEFCRAKLAAYKIPRSIDFRDTPFPVSGAGKVLKRDLRAPFWEGRDRGVN